MRITPQTLEVERPSEPFEIETDDGKVYTMVHSDALDVETLANLPFMSPLQQLEALVGEGDFEAFSKSTFGGNKIDGFFLKAVRPAYEAHYGLGEPGESEGSAG